MWHVGICAAEDVVSRDCAQAGGHACCCIWATHSQHSTQLKASAKHHVQDAQEGQLSDVGVGWGFQPWVGQAGAGIRGRTSVQEVWDDAASHLRYSSPAACTAYMRTRCLQHICVKTEC